MPLDECVPCLLQPCAVDVPVKLGFELVAVGA